MALDPSIILHAGAGVTPINVQSPAELQAINARNWMLQQERQKAADEQAVRDAFRANYRQPVRPTATAYVPDPNTWEPVAVQGAPSPGGLDQQGFMNSLAARGLYSQWLDAKQKSVAEHGERLKQASQRLDTIGRLAGSAYDQPSYEAALAQGRQMGLDLTGVPTVYNPTIVRQFQMQTMTAQQQLAQQLAEMEAARKAIEERRKLTEPQSAVGKIQADLAAKLITPEQAQAAIKAETEGKRTSVNVNGQGFAFPTGKTGEDAITSLPPAQQGIVRGIVEGRQKAPSGMALRTPYWQSVMQAVYAADPEWSEQRAEIRKAFTTGKDGQNIRSLNTATVHLQDYLEAAEALKNGTFRPGNALYNRISAALGRPAPTTFDTLKNAVAGEQASALKGTATDIEIANISKAMMNSNSPEQFQEAGKAALKVMRQKLNTYQESYSQQNPGDTRWSPVLPAASAVFERHGITGAKKIKPGQEIPQITVGMVPKKSDGSVLPDGAYRGFTVKGGKVVSVGEN